MTVMIQPKYSSTLSGRNADTVNHTTPAWLHLQFFLNNNFLNGKNTDCCMLEPGGQVTREWFMVWSSPNVILFSILSTWFPAFATQLNLHSGCIYHIILSSMIWSRNPTDLIHHIECIIIVSEQSTL